MDKPKSLKKLLLETVPGLKDNPESLVLFVDGGRIVGGNGISLSFEYRYSLNLVVESFAAHPDMLMVPVMAWIAQHQPELLGAPGCEPFTFEAEILDSENADIAITIKLTEPVIVARKDGGYTVDHPQPPPPRSLDQFEGVRGAKLWQLFLNDCLAAQTQDPAFIP